MYKLIYIQLYWFSKFAKEKLYSPMFYYTGIDGIILLSGLELLNIMTLWMYFEFDSISGNSTIDALIGLSIFLILNYFYFLHNDRYKRFIENSKNNPEWIKFIAPIGTIVYVILTLHFVNIVHSSKV